MSDLPTPIKVGYWLKGQESMTKAQHRAVFIEYASGRLVDREAIDYEPVARKMYHRATIGFPPNWAKADQGFWLDEARLALDAAIGGLG